MRKDMYKKVFITIIIAFITLGGASCGREQGVKPSLPTQPSQPIEAPQENKAQGNIMDNISDEIAKKAYSYLLEENIEVAEVIDENVERIITWEIICDDENVQMVNAFLDNEITKASERNGYGSVTVKSTTFLLKEMETIAEVFFIKDRIIGAVQYPKNDISKYEKEYRSLKGENIEQLLQMSYPLWTGEAGIKPAVYNIIPKNAADDGFGEIVQIHNLDSNRYILVGRNMDRKKDNQPGNSSNEIRLYVYDIGDNTDFYTGISYKEKLLPIRGSKQLQDNSIALILSDRISIVDGQSMKLIKEIKYPKDEDLYKDDFDISADGESIVFATKDGLTISDYKFGNSNILVKSKIGNDPSGLDWEVPRYPQFSPDSTRVMYRMVGYEWVVGTGIINTDGTDNKFYDAKREERSFTKWYNDQYLYSDSPSYSDSDYPALLDVNSGEQIELIKEKQEGKDIQFYLGEDDKLFYYETDISNSSGIRFGYYHINTGIFNQIMEIPQINLESTHYNSKNEVFIFTASKYPVSSKLLILTGL